MDLYSITLIFQATKPIEPYPSFFLRNRIPHTYDLVREKEESLYIMADKAIPSYPPLDDPERELWYESTYPDTRNINLQHFWLGIGVIEKNEILGMVKAIHDAIKNEAGEVSSKKDVEKMLQLRTILVEERFIRYVDDFVPGYDKENPVPESWLQLWVMTLFEQIWMHDYDGTKEKLPPRLDYPYSKEKEKEKKRPTEFASDKSASRLPLAKSGVPQKTSGTAATRAQPTQRPSKGKESAAISGKSTHGSSKPEIFELRVMAEDRQQEISRVRIDAKVTLEKDGSTYNRKLLLQTFQKALKENSQDINLGHGRLHYAYIVTRLNKNNEVNRPIRTDGDLQVAIPLLVKKAAKEEENNVLEFIFYVDNAADKKRRENTTLRKRSDKALEPKKSGPSNNPTPPPPKSSTLRRIKDMVIGVTQESSSKTPKSATGKRLSRRGGKSQKAEAGSTEEKEHEIKRVGFEEMSHETFIKGGHDVEETSTLNQDSTVNLIPEIGSEDNKNAEVENKVTPTEIMAHK